MSNLPSIFISYAREDSTFVDQLEAELSKDGFSTWMDRQHLEGGQDWATIIEVQIKRHDIVVVVLSPNSANSVWVQREIAFAQQIGKYIIPILLRQTQVPIRISELQHVDFTHDFMIGMIQLRTTLLNPPKVSQSPGAQQRLYTLPESIVQEPLVDIAPSPSEPDPDLELLYMQARSAMARQDWDTAEALLQQVIVRDPNYDDGNAKTDLATAHKSLLPIQIHRLQLKADAAHRAGRWGEEIGCWKTCLRLDPSDRNAQQRLMIAEQNQQSERIYKRAIAFVDAGDFVAARSETQRLQEKAPYYGDPEGLGKRLSVTLPVNYLDFQENELRRQTEWQRSQAQIQRQAQIQQEKQQRNRKIGNIIRIVCSIILYAIFGAIAFGSICGIWNIFQNLGGIVAVIFAALIGATIGIITGIINYFRDKPQEDVLVGGIVGAIFGVIISILGWFASPYNIGTYIFGSIIGVIGFYTLGALIGVIGSAVSDPIFYPKIKPPIGPPIHG